jgi:hypothetical protein
MTPAPASPPTSAEERLTSVARILAEGILRRRMRELERARRAAESAEIRLELSHPSSPHALEPESRSGESR